MKIFKQLSLAVTSVVAVGCIVGANQAFAVGAQGGGGGMSSGRNVANGVEIQQAVMASKFALKLAINQMLQTWYTAGTDHQAKVLQYILYRPHLFRDLSELKIHTQMGPCPYDGLKRDGNIRGNNVCISLGNLLKYNYGRDEILRKVTGLLGHEFAHRRGITFAHDSDANIMRDNVEPLVPLVEPATFVRRFSNVITDVTAADEAYATFRRNVTLGLPQTCATTMYVLTSDENLSNDLPMFGNALDSILSRKARNMLFASFFRVATASIFGCGINPSPKDNSILDLKRAWSSSASPMTIGDLLFRLSNLNARAAGGRLVPSKHEFMKGMCAGADHGCFGLNSTYISKIGFGNLPEIKSQLYKAQTELIEVESDLFPILQEAHALNDKFKRDNVEYYDNDTKTVWLNTFPDNKH